MNVRSKGTAIVSIVLAVALMAPSAAYAVDRVAAPSDATTTTVEDRTETLRDRIAEVLAERKQRFDAACERIRLRLEKVEGLADRVEEAGGDVSQVRTNLETSATALDRARELEAKAAELFRAVPDATDKRAAFRAARTTGLQAIRELDRARIELRRGAVELGRVVQEMKEQAGA